MTAPSSSISPEGQGAEVRPRRLLIVKVLVQDHLERFDTLIFSQHEQQEDLGEVRDSEQCRKDTWVRKGNLLAPPPAFTPIPYPTPTFYWSQKAPAFLYLVSLMEFHQWDEELLLYARNPEAGLCGPSPNTINTRPFPTHFPFWNATELSLPSPPLALTGPSGTQPGFSNHISVAKKVVQAGIEEHPTTCSLQQVLGSKSSEPGHAWQAAAAV